VAAYDSDARDSGRDGPVRRGRCGCWRSLDRRHKKPLSRGQQIHDLAKGLRQRFASDPKLEQLTHYRCIGEAVADALDPQSEAPDGGRTLRERATR
jgi:hypothetical protein